MEQEPRSTTFFGMDRSSQKGKLSMNCNEKMSVYYTNGIKTYILYMNIKMTLVYKELGGTLDFGPGLSCTLVT